jgi:hypothetical protein
MSSFWRVWSAGEQETQEQRSKSMRTRVNNTTSRAGTNSNSKTALVQHAGHVAANRRRVSNDFRLTDEDVYEFAVRVVERIRRLLEESSVMLYISRQGGSLG